MATAAPLTDRVFPRLPVGQWALVVPRRLCYCMQRDADLQSATLRLFLRAVEQRLRAHSLAPQPRPAWFAASSNASCHERLRLPERGGRVI